MPGMATIRVTAGPGRTVPLPASIASGPGGTPKLLMAPDEIEVDNTNPHIVLLMRSEDLVLCPEHERSAPAKTLPKEG